MTYGALVKITAYSFFILQVAACDRGPANPTFLDAIRKHDVADVNYYLSHGIYPRQPAMSQLIGWSDSASINDAIKIMDLLIAAGANVDEFDDDGHTPLFWAVWPGKSQLVKYLLDHGAKVNVPQTRFSRTPLHAAMLTGQVRIDFESVRLLVEHGANIDALDSLGKTAIDYAKKAGDTRVVKYLEEHRIPIVTQ